MTLLLAAGALAGAPARQNPPSRPIVSANRFASDLNASGEALQGVGRILQQATQLSVLRRLLPSARRQLARFDAAVRRMRGYRLAKASLERKRRALARAGPPLGATMRRFVVLGADGRLAQARALTPRLLARLQAFLAAART
jgi:hypothetical protein